MPGNENSETRRIWRTTMNQKTRESVTQKFEFRNIRPEETDQAVMIEQICFPPNEACSEDLLRVRI